MKKYLLMILAALLMAGCSNDMEVLNEAPATTGRTITIQATIDNSAASRLAFGESADGKIPLTWEKGDMIYLYNSNWDCFTFKATSVENDGTTATFTCYDANAPESLPDGAYTADCGAVLAPEQVGTKETVTRYIYMEAACTVENGKSYEGLTLNFAPVSPIVHATLTNEAFKNNDVTNVKFVCKEVGETTVTATSTFEKNDKGTIEVYFSVPNQSLVDSYNYAIQAKCGGKYYEVSLGKRQLEAGKFYHVEEKEMTEITSAATLLNLQIAEAANGVETTFELTDDIILSEADAAGTVISIPYGKHITIDGKGKHISVTSDALEGLGIFTLQRESSLTLKNVTVDADKSGVTAIYNLGDIILGEGATVNGVIINGGTLTLKTGSSVTASNTQAIVVRYGGIVTFNGGTVSSDMYEITLDMVYVEEENYIPLVCNAKPTEGNSALRLYMTTRDDNIQTIATVNYTGAAASDFTLSYWRYGFYPDVTEIKDASLSLSDGKLILTPPAE